jgi:hypothetical protein
MVDIGIAIFVPEVVGLSSFDVFIKWRVKSMHLWRRGDSTLRHDPILEFVLRWTGWTIRLGILG